ncbi:transposase [Moorena producens]|uniref:transposase n=1 Tax=Moorena producens TaxID=1155739 RepID=UPI0011EA646C
MSPRNAIIKQADRVTIHKWKLEEFKGEAYHVHLIVNFSSNNNLSDLISSLKSASSRIFMVSIQLSTISD